MSFTTIAFDADDTLWINEPYFNEAEQEFVKLMKNVATTEQITSLLFDIQIKNLTIYGYGIKGYILSMIETANLLTIGTIDPLLYNRILAIGKDLLQRPVVLIDGVTETLQYLQGKYKLVVATKGDLKDQHRKLHISGLGPFFHHIEVMVEKEMIDYEKMLNRLEVQPKDFLMIGNSLKSDVLPVLSIGATAVHVPFHTTWAHEIIDHDIVHDKFFTATTTSTIVDLLHL